MASEIGHLKAKTKKDLRKQVTMWIAAAKKKRMSIQLGWNEERITQTDEEYEITVRAHY